jgi:hypothetical protein
MGMMIRPDDQGSRPFDRAAGAHPPRSTRYRSPDRTQGRVWPQATYIGDWAAPWRGTAMVGRHRPGAETQRTAGWRGRGTGGMPYGTGLLHSTPRPVRGNGGIDFTHTVFFLQGSDDNIIDTPRTGATRWETWARCYGREPRMEHAHAWWGEIIPKPWQEIHIMHCADNTSMDACVVVRSIACTVKHCQPNTRFFTECIHFAFMQNVADLSGANAYEYAIICGLPAWCPPTMPDAPAGVAARCKMALPHVW